MPKLIESKSEVIEAIKFYLSIFSLIVLFFLLLGLLSMTVNT